MESASKVVHGSAMMNAVRAMHKPAECDAPAQAATKPPATGALQQGAGSREQGADARSESLPAADRGVDRGVFGAFGSIGRLVV